MAKALESGSYLFYLNLPFLGYMILKIKLYICGVNLKLLSTNTLICTFMVNFDNVLFLLRKAVNCFTNVQFFSATDSSDKPVAYTFHPTNNDMNKTHFILSLGSFDTLASFPIPSAFYKQLPPASYHRD